MSPHDQQDVAKLVPEIDSFSQRETLILRPDFFSASNNFFWEAIIKWQEILEIGGFEVKKKRPPKGKKVEKDFKDDSYELYWGYRLKRDRESKKKITTDKKKPPKRT